MLDHERASGGASPPLDAITCASRPRPARLVLMADPSFAFRSAASAMPGVRFDDGTDAIVGGSRIERQPLK